MAFAGWPHHVTDDTDLDTTVLGKDKKPTQDVDHTVRGKKKSKAQALAEANEGEAFLEKPTANVCNQSLETNADWKLVTCTSAVSGELSHEVSIGITKKLE